ncbi:MAG: hypothetical protein ACLFWL_08905 [Candidatus Brocadiia bacterium]
MIQAIFDDQCAETRHLWRYPDTDEWDPDRNTNEFCEQLPTYRSYGLLAVTVGLQGGGSIYTPEIYEKYENSAYTPDGQLREPYFDRLSRILEASDRAGMVVIVNYFYVMHGRRIQDEATVYEITEKVTDWLLESGHENVLVDVANEAGELWDRPIFQSDGIHNLIETVQSRSLEGRRLLASSSTPGGVIPDAKRRSVEDFSLPHGNGCTPEELRTMLRNLKDTPEFRERPRPIVINEDSIHLENLAAAVDEYASWGYFSQGYGSDCNGSHKWNERPREERYEDLSGFQTVPVNWSINTERKRRFFDRIKKITSSED